ncbi:hypothetical protein [Larkinella soli]|uniref:hypothetical protein n=1 Tax=Larkinella soli TaxID=1770527 RepID=UPI000FFC12E8|nr:hypothetical protein [Larkinella soli]
MKPRVIALILLPFICLSLSLQAQTADVLLLKKGAPFPFASGAALDQRVYDQVKAKLAAAEQLRIDGEKAIADLKLQITALETALKDKQAIIEYDAQSYRELYQKYAVATEALKAADHQVQQTTDVIERVKALLPRKLRKRSLTAPEIALSLEEMAEKLRKRPLKWGLAGALLGAIGALVIAL